VAEGGVEKKSRKAKIPSQHNSSEGKTIHAGLERLWRGNQSSRLEKLVRSRIEPNLKESDRCQRLGKRGSIGKVYGVRRTFESASWGWTYEGVPRNLGTLRRKYKEGGNFRNQGIRLIEDAHGESAEREGILGFSGGDSDKGGGAFGMGREAIVSVN